MKLHSDYDGKSADGPILFEVLTQPLYISLTVLKHAVLSTDLQFESVHKEVNIHDVT